MKLMFYFVLGSSLATGYKKNMRIRLFKKRHGMSKVARRFDSTRADRESAGRKDFWNAVASFRNQQVRINTHAGEIRAYFGTRDSRKIRQTSGK